MIYIARSMILRTAGVLGLVLLLMSGQRPAYAEQSYTSNDKNLTFNYPGSWKADNAGDRVRLTASDGSHFFLLRDTLTPRPTGSPASDPSLKARAAELIKPILKDADFVSVQTVTMDHGEGAVFRFHAKGTSDGPASAIYIAIVGNHSLVLLPERAGQPSQSIGLATVFQSVAFTDALPRQPAAPRRPVPSNSGTTPVTGITGVGTVSFSKQIAPILNSKCEVCHRSRSPLGGLSVTTYAEFIKGGSHGSLIVPGSPQSSLLMDYLTGRRDLMPKGGPPLPDDQIALIRKWIAEGAREEIGSATPPMTNDPSTMTTADKIRCARQQIGAGGNAIRPGRMNRLQGVGADTAASDLKEAYSGHLVPNDLGFTLRMNQNKTATAVWSLAPGREVRYSGTYVGDEGNYLITMTEVSTGTPTGRSLTLDLRARGSQETGRYGTDGASPRRDIALLELSETATTSKGGGKGGANQAATNNRAGNGQGNRGRRRK